jgi:hypothetical protein
VRLRLYKAFIKEILECICWMIFNFSLHFVCFSSCGTCRKTEVDKMPRQLTFVLFLHLFAEKSLYFLTSSPFVSLFDEILTILSRVRIIAKSDSQLHHVSISLCLSVFLSSLSSVYHSFPMFFNSLYCIIIFLKTHFFAFWRFSLSINTLQKDLQKFCTIVPEVNYL